MVTWSIFNIKDIVRLKRRSLSPCYSQASTCHPLLMAPWWRLTEWGFHEKCMKHLPKQTIWNGFKIKVHFNDEVIKMWKRAKVCPSWGRPQLHPQTKSSQNTWHRRFSAGGVNVACVATPPPPSSRSRFLTSSSVLLSSCHFICRILTNEHANIIAMRNNKLHDGSALSLSVAPSSLLCFWRVTSAECASLISLDISRLPLLRAPPACSHREAKGVGPNTNILDLWNLPLSSSNKARKGTDSSHVCVLFFKQLRQDVRRRCCSGMCLLSLFCSCRILMDEDCWMHEVT